MQHSKFRTAGSRDLWRGVSPAQLRRTGLWSFALGLSVVGAVLLEAGAAMAQSESVLLSMPDHSRPYARPYEDATGALYVPTYFGNNAGGAGSVFELSEKHTIWKGRTIFHFNGPDGQNPVATLIADPNGVLYGTTQHGGANHGGTVYSLTLVNGRWIETVLHDFTGGADGGDPLAGLERNNSTGTLYGSTSSGGGNYGCGTAFSLVPSGGDWTFNMLYSFAGGSDGCNPNAGFRPGSKSGTLFGTTLGGGANNAGTVFELMEKNGAWTESRLYSFTGGNDGNMPVDLDLDTKQDGTLYGVTSGGGEYRSGVVFELSNIRHNWTQSVLYSFTGGMDGNVPVGLHLETPTGTLYGTTETGGSYGYGTLFKLVKSGSSWAETGLHSFGATGNDGLYPESRPTEDSATGVLYGTTISGGRSNSGVVYEVVP